MVYGGERVEVGVWFENGGDPFGFLITDMALPVVGSEESAHNVTFVRKVMGRFSDSNGGVSFEGKGQFDPRDSRVAGRNIFSVIFNASVM